MRRRDGGSCNSRNSVLQVAPDLLSGSISTGKAELVAVNAKETTFDQVIILWASEAGVNTKRY